jgi:hypothetical protein
MRSFSVAIALTLLSTLRAEQALAADCTTEAQTQVHELAVFSDMKRIKNCDTPEGKAAYKESAALLDKLNERSKELVILCPASDSRFEYAQSTLKNLTNIFKIVSRGCGS